MLGAAAAALLVIGGTVYAVTSGDDDKKPAATGPDLSAPASGPAESGDDSDNGGGVAGADPGDLNEGRQAGESKVLWSKDAPDAPASGADANGMWITDKVAVKAAYKEVFAFRVADGETAWGRSPSPEDLRRHPAEVGRRQDRGRLYERRQPARQMQQAPVARPEHGREGLER